MLRIGQRQYELVRSQSGFFVELFPPDLLKRTQEWRLDAHYVPADGSAPRDDNKWEYLRLTIHSEKYHLDNWRNLTGLGLDNDDDDWFGSAGLENLLAGRFKHEEDVVIPGRLDLTMAGEYLFHCTFDGTLRRDGAEEEDLEFEDDIPFAGVSVGVPINSADPVATALALAGGRGAGRNFRQPHDPARLAGDRKAARPAGRMSSSLFADAVAASHGISWRTDAAFINRAAIASGRIVR